MKAAESLDEEVYVAVVCIVGSGTDLVAFVFVLVGATHCSKKFNALLFCIESG